jgi:hypothetical protein
MTSSYTPIHPNHDNDVELSNHDDKNKPLIDLAGQPTVAFPRWWPRRVTHELLKTYTYYMTTVITVAYIIVVCVNWGTTKNDDSKSKFTSVSWTYLSDGFDDDRALMIYFMVSILFFWLERMIFEILLMQYQGFSKIGYAHFIRIIALNLQMLFILLIGAVSLTEDIDVHHWLTRLAAGSYAIHEILWFGLGLRDTPGEQQQQQNSKQMLSTRNKASFLHIVLFSTSVACAVCFSMPLGHECHGGRGDQAWYEYVLFLMFALVPLIHVYTLPTFP